MDWLNTGSRSSAQKQKTPKFVSLFRLIQSLGLPLFFINLKYEETVYNNISFNIIFTINYKAKRDVVHVETLMAWTLDSSCMEKGGPKVIISQDALARLCTLSFLQCHSYWQIRPKSKEPGEEITLKVRSSSVSNSSYFF